MMKKFFLLFVFCVMATSSYAMYWGCNNLTKEEVEKAKSVLKEAQEIVLLSYPYTPNIIKYDDIKETLYDAGNDGFVKMFKVHNFGVYGANDLFVRFNDKEKYQNLGIIIECEAPLIDFVKEINPDLSFITLKDKYFKIKERYESCENVKDDEIYDEEYIKNADVRQRLSDVVDCYVNVAFELFDTFHPSNSQKYKDNLQNFIQYYANVQRDIYSGMEGHVTGTIIADYVSASVYSMVKDTVNSYIEETGEAGDFIEQVE